ncbi:hypothetical protein M0R45_010062 [Rubus argutus]|uniref:NB-ARC domain-containing protein n=1 Tax=Rubus argutus TaxID=59490 RepID=A0AAW1Y5V2_RUBAR
MVDICLSIAGKLAEYTVAPVLRQFGYLVHFGSNVGSLNSRVERLDARRKDLERRVEAATDNLQIISTEVENWLRDSKRTIQEKKACFEDASIAKATCCSNGWFPNLKVRHSLSRKAKKMTPDVDKLLEQGHFTSISSGARRPKIEYPAMPYYEDSTIASSPSGASNPTNPPAPMDLSERLEYRLPYTKDLLKSLQDDNINMIGISGIIREIDTVTTKEFIKRMKQRYLFKEVVMAVASQQNPDLKRIQGEIADMLHLKLENGSLVERAQRLHAAMSAILDSKRLLLILADVWKVPDLEAIGISPGDDNKRCKIILISQLPNVFSELTTRTNFELLLQSTPRDRPVEFESRISIIRDVMDALTDDESNPIVLCGMGGIGKTTLVMEIGAKASEVDLFDNVAIAEFTQEPDLVKIQGKIAKALGLELRADDDRAAKLRERISGGTKRVLLILDNVWTQLDLWEVGIPIFRYPKSCKLLVSSRNQDIFQEMKTRKNFPIGGLSIEDAWSLFKKVAGGSVECDPELRPIAEQVLDECGGLPVAITTVGRALQGKSITNWRDAHRQLRKACPEDVPGVIEHVYGKIEFSYECLPSEQAKSCFLLCCLFPESGSFPIEFLFRLGFGLGLFKGIDSIAEGRDNIKTLVDTLKSRFLLLDGDEEDGVEVVKMHDVVRDVAMYIASAESTQKKNDGLEKRIVLRQRMELNGWPMNEESTCTSLATSTGGLTELLLLINERELELPATIFNGMEDLKVLLILGSTLPSFPLLKNLQTLMLGDCHLNLDVIGELRTLMILDLRGSDVQILPDTFKNLSNLRMLDLTKCEELKTIAAGVISSLSQLEELYMWDSFQDWVVEKLASTETTDWISQLEERGQPEEEVDMWKILNRLEVEKRRSEPEELEDLGRLYKDVVASSNRKDEHTKWANSMDWTVGILSELLSLSRLTTLEVILPPVDILLRTSCKLFHKLERFKISIGWDLWEEHEGLEDYENYLRVADLDASSIAGTGISFLLKKTNALELKLKNLSDPLNVLDCANLEFLKLEDCDALEYFINTTSLTEHTPRSIFPVLNYMCINGASKLKEIFPGNLPQGSLQKLKELVLWNLPALTYVWKVESKSGCLGNLAAIYVETLCIYGCQSLEAIFGLVGSGHHEEEAPLEINFLSLTQLILNGLPSFTWISNRNYKGVARLPEVNNLYPNSVTVEHSLFFDPKVYFPVLRHLYIIGVGKLKEIWNKQPSPNSFCELTFLSVENCDELLHLVPTHMQSRLQKLETIWAENCSSLEEIFEVRRLTVNEGDASTISSSKKIPSSISQPDQGMQLNNIMDFKQSRQGFQNIKSLQVTRCRSLRYLFSPSIARGLVKLERLYIRDCEKIEEIIAAAEGEEKEDESILPRLKDLSILDLPNLGSFSQGRYTFEWSLKDIDIRKCNKMNNFCSGSLSIPRKVRITVLDSGENLKQELINCRKES